MSVYKEGYYCLEQLIANSKRIYPDACDFGCPVNKDDIHYNFAKQLVNDYGEIDTREEWLGGVSINVVLKDEWAISDRRKSMIEGTETYKVTFCRVVLPGYTGFVCIDKIPNKI